ncbi:MAG: nuclear transport factor 2 family protein [Sphingobacteriaceae bacterium]|nr:nuclear transport factor 2 family protein [Sphingobacteriaceae bacterium]
MTAVQAKDFALDWIHSWNSHDLNSIMEHYDTKIEFHSPFIPLLKFNETGIIKSKEELAKYFKIGLDAYPDLRFKLHNVFTGINTITVYYASVNSRMAAEVFHLNKNGKATKVFCNYSNNSSIY